MGADARAVVLAVLAAVLAVLAVAVAAAALGAFASGGAFASTRPTHPGPRHLPPIAGRRRRWRRRAEVGAQGHRPRLHRQVWLARAVPVAVVDSASSTRGCPECPQGALTSSRQYHALPAPTGLSVTRGAGGMAVS
jgi:hypothetical protein